MSDTTHTDESGEDQNTEAVANSTEEGQTTTPATDTEQQAQEETSDWAENLAQEAVLEKQPKAPRKEKTLHREVKKLSEAIGEEGDIDYDVLRENYRPESKVSQKALKKLADDNNLDFDDLQYEIEETQTDDRYEDQNQRLATLEKREADRERTGELNEYNTYFKGALSDYGLSNADFVAQYKADWETSFKFYSKSNSLKESAKIAFAMTVGKDHDIKQGIQKAEERAKGRLSHTLPPQSNSTGQKSSYTQAELAKLPQIEYNRVRDLEIEGKVQIV